MTDGFLNIDSTRVTGHGLWGYHSDTRDSMAPARFRTAVGWLPMAVVVTVAGWLLVSFARDDSKSRLTHLASSEVSQTKPVSFRTTVGLAREPSFNPAISEAIVVEQPAPVDGLKISSQSWRRGGLGSNAFVTMTVRNDNSYAVKDIAVVCAFSRLDGSHLTDRSRVVHEAVNTKSRKTFVKLHVGFVNVNAAKARCSLVAVSHI